MQEEHKRFLWVGILAAAISLAAFVFFYRAGTVLYFGDAVAHLNIARKLTDNKSPGYSQIGTVWLPLPHLLAAPFVAWDSLWRTGIGGAIPSMAAFVLGALFLFGLAGRLLEETALAYAALAIYLTNVNLLYLQSTPMGEAQALAAFLAALYFASQGSVLAAAVAIVAGTLIRYDFWFFLPFFALYFWRTQGLRRAAVFTAIAGLGPVLWLAHNWSFYGHPLEWLTGPYSAQAIQQRSLAAGGQPHPGHDSLYVAALYYWKCAWLVVGRGPLAFAALGALVLMMKGQRAVPLLLWLPFVFYTLAIRYASVPIYVPQWWPFSFYNTRYGIEMLPAAALLAPATLLALPRWRRQAALALALAVTGAWVLGVTRHRADGAVVFREAQVNSTDRRYAAGLVARELKRGCHEIWLSSGDVSGALVEAGIPWRRTIHEGNEPEWRLVSRRPESLVDCVVTQEGDAVSRALARLPEFEQSFQPVLDLAASGVARVRVFRRRHPAGSAL